jgi:hypothetical protein
MDQRASAKMMRDGWHPGINLATPDNGEKYLEKRLRSIRLTAT